MTMGPLAEAFLRSRSYSYKPLWNQKDLQLSLQIVPEVFAQDLAELLGPPSSSVTTGWLCWV